MFIDKIEKFINGYENFKKEEFLEILDISNSKNFNIIKFEKDFLLTLILIKFGEKYPDLIFKGGTCLNKIYFPYFRLSEDLDYVLNFDLSRDKRKKFLKEYEENFVKDLEILGISLKQERTKFDEHKLAMFTFEYKSVISNSIQTVKIDISLKNQLKLDPYKGKIKSIFVDKIFDEDVFGEHFINCINLKEAVAEKIRAALTRKIPAIRDFFDIWFVKNNSDFDFKDEEFKNLVFTKLEEVDFKYTLEENYDLLKKQIKTDLEPVLNEDFDFDFDGIYEFILNFKK